MNTYPINPSDRLQRRICTILTNDLISLPLFLGFSARNGREFTQEKYPFFSVQATDNQEVFPGTNAWRVGITVAMVEDREEANQTFGGDTRPRHELRAENLSARLFGVWNGLSLPDAINAINNGEDIYVVKMYAKSQANGTMSEDEISTEYSFSVVCATTEQ